MITISTLYSGFFIGALDVNNSNAAWIISMNSMVGVASLNCGNFSASMRYLSA